MTLYKKVNHYADQIMFPLKLTSVSTLQAQLIGRYDSFILRV